MKNSETVLITVFRLPISGVNVTVSGEGLRRSALVVLSHRGYNIYGLGDPGGDGIQGETLERQPLVPWLLRQPLWAEPNTYAGGGPTPCD
jgi:hypothetical protein